jgi:DNA polymerase III subunit gamma/tau
MDSTLLTLKYRPRTFSDMVGQKAVRAVLKQLVVSGRLPGGLLLHGGWGAGKTTAARIIAAALNCEREDAAQRPCGQCVTCESSVDGRSPDVLEIDAASSNRVEDMRELREQVRFAPMRRVRVVILDEVHALSAAAFQALLKILEEPAGSVLFVLATTNLDRVPETIVSRCFNLEFRRITVPDIAGRVQYIADSEGYEMESGLATAIAGRSHGALRDGVMLLQQCMTVGVRNPAQLVALMGDTDVEVEILLALARSDLPKAFELAQRGLEALPSPSDLIARLVTCLRRRHLRPCLPPPRSQRRGWLQRCLRRSSRWRCGCCGTTTVLLLRLLTRLLPWILW